MQSVSASIMDLENAVKEMGVEFDDKEKIRTFDDTAKSYQKLLNNDRAYTKL